MDGQEIQTLFAQYNKKYFWGKLNKVNLSWSPYMTLCAGQTTYRVRGQSFSSCSIRLSQPILSQRPHSDTVDTLLHEMIHAYLHVTQGCRYRDSHGPEFWEHMTRINDLEGSNITVYHNFKREVDKFRIHVYRCDGPCINKRPYFGILRRAIARPPDPSDKWWARHNQECGGTFHKIEGPGVVPPTDSKGETKPKHMFNPWISTSSNLPSNMPLVQPNASNSCNSSNIEYHYSDKNNVHINTPEGSHITRTSGTAKSHKTAQQSLPSDDRCRSYNEDHILQRIKTKYSNPKRSILLSKEDTKKAYCVRRQNRQKRGKSPEKGTLIDGNVNCNYIARSSSKIYLQKYLNRFREARNLKSFVTHKPNVLSAKCKSDTRSVIEKYMNRFYEAKKLQNSLLQTTSESNASLFTLPSTSISKDNSFKAMKKDDHKPTNQGSSTSCPMCNISISNAVYEQHIQECFGDDLDIEMNESHEKVEPKKVIDTSPKCMTKESREVDSNWNEHQAKICPNCKSLILAPEMKLHLEYCFDSENDDDADNELLSKSSDKNEIIHFDAYHKVTDVVSCPSCMENVEKHCIQEHLSNCLPLFSEEFD